jgi:hypothetical protein
MGLTFAPLSESDMASVRGNRQGQASGAFNSIRELGGVFGVAILGAVFQHIYTSPGQFLIGFRAALVGGAAIVVVGVLSSLLLPSIKRPLDRSETQTAVALAETA